MIQVEGQNEWRVLHVKFGPFSLFPVSTGKNENYQFQENSMIREALKKKTYEEEFSKVWLLG